MRLTVRHATTYSYSRPMRALVQSIRLFPSLFDGQTARDWTVRVEGQGEGPDAAAQAVQAPGGMMQGMGMTQVPGPGVMPSLAVSGTARIGAAFRDGAGDRTETVTVRGPVERVVIAVSGEVVTADTAGILRGHREQVAPGVYLRPTLATEADVTLTELARAVIAGRGGGPQLGLAHALAAAVSEAIAYEAGATGPGTTAAEAFGRGRGVCQDHAHALIALAHVAGIPARYVVGYLATDAGLGEASHAWAELHVEGLGWVGFDPANRCCPDERYIRLCSGFDARDAAPIRGVALGAETEHMTVDVAVERQQQ